MGGTLNSRQYIGAVAYSFNLPSWRRAVRTLIASARSLQTRFVAQSLPYRRDFFAIALLLWCLVVPSLYRPVVSLLRRCCGFGFAAALAPLPQVLLSTFAGIFAGEDDDIHGDSGNGEVRTAKVDYLAILFPLDERPLSIDKLLCLG